MKRDKEKKYYGLERSKERKITDPVFRRVHFNTPNAPVKRKSSGGDGPRPVSFRKPLALDEYDDSQVISSRASKDTYEKKKSYSDFEQLPVRAFFKDFKFVDWHLAGKKFYELSQSPEPILPNYVERGLQRYNRIGNEIDLISLRVSGYIFPTLLNTYESSWQAVRMVVAYQKYQAHNTQQAPTFDSVYKYCDKDGNQYFDIYAPLNIANGSSDNFVTLLDKKWLLPPMGTLGEMPATRDVQSFTYGDKQNFFFDEFIDLRGYDTSFAYGPLDYAVINHGAIFCWLIAQTTTLPAPVALLPYAVNIAFRTRFEE